jgi:hypothetical protein
MKRYHTGRTAEGHDTFVIPLDPDEDGMIGRECPNENCRPRYFKVSARKSEDRNDSSSGGPLTCPYCGEEASIQLFHTKEQLAWIKSMFARDLALSIQDMLKSTIRPIRSKRSGFLSISMEYKPGNIPNVRPYAEEKLKRTVQCDKCGNRYAVYGVSYKCPFCGEGNLLLHVRRSVEIIQSQLDAEQLVKQKAGEEAVYHLWGNCLEDAVSLFEGFLKSIYSKIVIKRYGKQEAEEKIMAIKGSFQRLSDASKVFSRDLNIDILTPITEDELDFLNVLFNKRHVITHSLGLVDERFQSRISQWQRCGEELEMSRQDVLRGLNLIERIIDNVVQKSDLI